MKTAKRCSGWLSVAKLPALVSFLAAITVLGQTESSSALPRFDRYGVASVFHGLAAKPQFESAPSYPDGDPKFRDAVLDEVSRGVNFAGHYAIVQWSCGSGCRSIAVVDVATGAMYRQMPYHSLLVGPFRSDSGALKQCEGLQFRVGSRLLIAEGCFDTADGPGKGYCGREYFEWRDGRFVTIRSVRRKENR